jgi:outer membrane protein TolC
MVRDQMKKITTFAKNYQLFHGKIVPLANQAVQTTRMNYESDKTSFLELITVRRSLQDVDSAELDYLTNYNVSLSELEAIVGNSISAGSALHPISK